jgi:hypothetical protein
MAVFEGLGSGGDGDRRAVLHVVGKTVVGAGAAGGRRRRRRVPRGSEMHGGGGGKRRREQVSGSGSSRRCRGYSWVFRNAVGVV